MSYELEDISGIGKAIADRFRAAGIDTVEKLASSDPTTLINLKIKGIGESTAIKYINNAKTLIEDKQKTVSPETNDDKQKLAVDSIKRQRISEKLDEDKLLKFNEYFKKQAECNIGLVGHVDHGMN